MSPTLVLFIIVIILFLWFLQKKRKEMGDFFLHLENSGKLTSVASMFRQKKMKLSKTTGRIIKIKKHDGFDMDTAKSYLEITTEFNVGSKTHLTEASPYGMAYMGTRDYKLQERLTLLCSSKDIYVKVFYNPNNTSEAFAVINDWFSWEEFDEYLRDNPEAKFN
jgi:hypothetical protein